MRNKFDNGQEQLHQNKNKTKHNNLNNLPADDGVIDKEEDDDGVFDDDDVEDGAGAGAGAGAGEGDN